MMRSFVSFSILGLLLCTPCYGQEWAGKMFKDSDHDFGVVARGAKVEFPFELENLYLEDVHIAGVRSSCGCTSTRVENPSLKTYEKGAVVAVFNTTTFTGQHGATLTVTIDKPFYAEVQLHVKGFVRTDVVFEPGSIQLGSLDQGAGAEREATVSYLGRHNWKILDVKCANPHITAKAVESGRDNGRVSYQLKVHVDADAPAGYVNDRLLLVTNDPNAAQIPLEVEGRITPGISVSPAALFMGVVPSGQRVTKQLVVKGKTPFKILRIECDDASFQFDTSKEDTAKLLHLIPVTYTAGADAGRVAKTIKIQTDQGEMAPELAAYAVVTAAQ